jgi:iron complex transport system ATP-binding protein
MKHALTTNNLSVSVGEKTILYPTTISIEMGEMTAIIGANGAGKSTFMRAALGLIPHSGLSSLSSKTINERMKFASWVSQDRELVWDVRVKTLLQFTLERTLRTIDKSFQKKLTGINEALELTNISQLADQQVNSLSGGEVTAVLIARTLVQQTPIIFLDEPLASLDPIQKIKILSLLRSLSKSGRTIIASLHDIKQSATYFSRYIGIKNGTVVIDAAPIEAINKQNFNCVFVK